VAAEVLDGAQFDVAAEGVLELQLHLGQVQEAGSTLRMELDEEVHVAGRAEVVAQDRAEQGESAYAVPRGEVAQHCVIHAQPQREIHAVMMPHRWTGRLALPEGCVPGTGGSGR
jgi:hypothetical protein